MKKLFLLPFIFSIIIFNSCQSDQARQDAFVGTYIVTLDSPKAEKELSEAKKGMQEDIEQAKEDIRRGIEEAQDDIETEFGEDSDFGNAIGSFVEGIGHFAEGMTELGESLGELGIDLGSNILGEISFTAEFQSDGDVEFGRGSKIRINGNDEVKWEIENGKIYLWNEDENRKSADEFEMKKVSETEWDLIREDVVFHLTRKEGN